VIEHGIDRVRRRAPGLTFMVTTKPWIVFGDATALERAVTNLLDNAAKWSPAGGTVTVTFSAASCRSRRGPGISAEDVPHVFDRFYRATDARACPAPGSARDRPAGSRKARRFVRAGRTDEGGALMTLGIPGGLRPVNPRGAVAGPVFF